MARVFGVGELIWEKPGLGLPTREDFKLAKDLALGAVYEGFSNGIFSGGRIVGSVARGEPTPRSDVDLLIAPNLDYLEEVTDTLRELGSLTTDGGTSLLHVTSCPVRMETMMEPHTFRLFQTDPYEGNLIGDDPLQHVTISKRPDKESLREVAFKALAYFSRRDRSPKELPAQILSQALGAPRSIARKLSVMNSSTWAGQDIASVLGGLSKVIGSVDTRLMVDELTRGDNEYSALLDSAIQGEVSKREYATWMKEASLFYPVMAEGFYTRIINLIDHPMLAEGQLYLPGEQEFFLGKKER